MVKKLLVVSVIVLFFGVAIAPNINAEINRTLDKSDEILTDNSTPTVDYFRSKNIKHQDYINVQSNTSNYYKKWISPLQDRSSSFISTNNQGASSKTINDVPQNTYNGKTLYVGGNGPGNYSLIQMATFAASDGDTIFVYAGIYRQWFWTLRIDKSIRLLGEDPESTIIVGKRIFWQGNPVIDVCADDVTISGFTIFEDIPSKHILGDSRDCGVWIYRGARNCVVSGNIFTKGVHGVFLSSYYGAPTFITVTNNIFRDNIKSGLFMDGVTQSVIENNSFFNCSMRIWESYHNRFNNNTINGKPLIVLEDASDVIIQEAGQVVLIGCTNITVVNTTIMGAYIGIWLQHSQYCTIIGNYLKNCYESGIFLEWSDNNNITNNLIDNCYVGLLLGDSHLNRVQTNHIIGNWECTLLMSMAEQNVIDRNTFDNNAPYSILHGIYLTGGTKNNDITNNTLINDTLYIHNAWQNRIINNTVNGKPLIHLEGASGNVIDYPAGQIILINCDSIEIRNQIDIVIHVFGCHSCLFENVSPRTNKRTSLFILYSQYINITNCVVYEGGYGVQIQDSSHLVIQNNLFMKNIYSAVYIINCTDVSVVHNSFEENGGYAHPSEGPVYIRSSKSIEVRRNNFLDNVKGGYFERCRIIDIIWDGNYWDQPRTLPKVIPGWFRLVSKYYNRFDFDWNPAKEPYDIGV
ncbi:MAG: right-handed parallel beta-helix repeat-containing protein [Thermoplasmatales archaeon]|nr:MAG: right-handed parallel beta-helix repeat-containing protein [Thermoplasmatales archaeon]